jgi:methenyltetrahydrofolate cyclohydrolase
VAAAAAALLEKAARLSAKQWSGAADARQHAHALRLHAEELIDEDVQAYLGYVASVRSGIDLEGARSKTVDVPLELVRLAAAVATLADQLASKGNPKLRADAVVAAILAAAAAESGLTLITVNIAGRDDVRLHEAQKLASQASELARSLRSEAP